MVIVIRSGPGFDCSWIEDNRVLAITTTSVARESVDAFVIFITELLDRWPVEKKLLCLQEFAPDLTVTPYLREKGAHIMGINRTDITGRLALVTPNLVAFTIFELSFQSTGNMFPNIEKRAFIDRDSALSWLLGNHTE
jgi:hypothetical protein